MCGGCGSEYEPEDTHHRRGCAWGWQGDWQTPVSWLTVMVGGVLFCIGYSLVAIGRTCSLWQLRGSLERYRRLKGNDTWATFISDQFFVLMGPDRIDRSICEQRCVCVGVCVFLHVRAAGRLLSRSSWKQLTNGRLRLAVCSALSYHTIKKCSFVEEQIRSTEAAEQQVCALLSY